MKNTERFDQKSSGVELGGWTYGSGYKVYIPFRLTSVPTENIHSNRNLKNHVDRNRAKLFMVVISI